MEERENKLLHVFAFVAAACCFLTIASLALANQRSWVLCGKLSLPPVAEYAWFCLDANPSDPTWQAGGLQGERPTIPEIEVDLCGTGAFGEEALSDPLCWKADAVLPAGAFDESGQLCAPLHVPAVGTWERFCFNPSQKTWRGFGFRAD